MTANVLVPLLLEAVEQLNTELLRIHHCVREVAVRSCGTEAEIASVRGSLRRAFSATRAIHDCAMIEDEIPGDLRVSSLRARAVVVALRCADLGRVSRGLVNYIPIGQFVTVDAFTDHVLDQIGRINATWSIEVGEAAASHLWSPRESLMRAEAAYADIGRNPDVQRFLQWAIAHGPIGVSEASVEIARVLEVATPTRAKDDVDTLPLHRRSSPIAKKN